MFSRTTRPSGFILVGAFGIMAVILLLSPIVSQAAILAYSASTDTTHGFYLFDITHRIHRPIVRQATTLISRRSPDGARFAYVQAFEDGTMQIVVAGIHGRNPQPIYPSNTLTGQVGSAPFWNADGTQLLFTFMPEDSESFQVVRYTLATDDLETFDLTSGLNGGKAPFVWMPDGTLRYVALSSSRVYLIALSLDTLERTVVQEWDFATQIRLTPILAPDGMRFALPAIADRSFDFEIYVFDTTTETVINLSRRPLHIDTTPVWSPDGQVLYYRATNNAGQFLIAQPLAGESGSVVYSHRIATLNGFVPTGDGDYLALVLSGVGQPDTLCIVNLLDGHTTCPIRAEQIFNLSWWE